MGEREGGSKRRKIGPREGEGEVEGEGEGEGEREREREREERERWKGERKGSRHRERERKMRQWKTKGSDGGWDRRNFEQDEYMYIHTDINNSKEHSLNQHHDTDSTQYSSLSTSQRNIF